MVVSPGEYRWSSYVENGRGDNDRLIQAHPLYRSLGNTDSQRRQAYREFFRHHLDDTQVHVIRDALGRELVLGREAFKDRVEQMLKRQARFGWQGCLRIEESGAIYAVVLCIGGTLWT